MIIQFLLHCNLYVVLLFFFLALHFDSVPFMSSTNLGNISKITFKLYNNHEYELFTKHVVKVLRFLFLFVE